MPRYGSLARARVALSVAARDVSDSARQLVPTQTEEPPRGAELVERASHLAARAQQLLELAVIVERERGTPWEAVGRALRVSRQAVHERFSPAVDRWKQGLREPWVAEAGSAELTRRLPVGAEDVEGWAKQLDEWMGRHPKPGQDPGDRPVSAALPQAGERELETMYLEQLAAVSRRLSSKEADALHAGARHALQRHRVELLETLAALRPNAPAYAEAAAHAREQLAAAPGRLARARRR